MQTRQHTCDPVAFAAALPGKTARRPAPLARVPHAVPDPHSTCSGRTGARHEVEQWAMHAQAANGFGDAATNDSGTADPERSAARGSADPVTAARGHARLTGAIVSRIRALRRSLDRALFRALVRSLAGALLRLYERWQRNRRARDLYVALHALDAHLLRDLGLHRSEILSLATEISGGADITRVHTLRAQGVASPGTPSARAAFPLSSQGVHHAA